MDLVEKSQLTVYVSSAGLEYVQMWTSLYWIHELFFFFVLSFYLLKLNSPPQNLFS